MVITSPRSGAAALSSIPTDWADEREHRKILARGVQQLQEIVLKHPVEIQAAHTGNYTMVDTDLLIRGDATSGNITITLLTAASRKGRRVIVKKVDASANLVTIDAAGTETLNDNQTVGLTQKHASREYVSNGTNWDLVAAIGNATDL